MLGGVDGRHVWRDHRTRSMTTEQAANLRGQSECGRTWTSAGSPRQTLGKSDWQEPERQVTAMLFVEADLNVDLPRVWPGDAVYRQREWRV